MPQPTEIVSFECYVRESQEKTVEIENWLDWFVVPKSFFYLE